MTWIMEGYKEKEEKNWGIEKSEVMCDGKCPYVVKDEPLVVFSSLACRQIKTLCRKYEQLEWLAGLVGEDKSKKDERLTFYISKIELFEQKVSGVTCELTDKGNEDMAKSKVLGWIHSHNNMDVFFSNTDEETAGMSLLSFCVNNKMEIKGAYRRKLPCGTEALIDVEVERQFEDDAEIVNKADELIDDKQIVVSRNGYSTSVIQSQIGDFCLICAKEVGRKKKRQVADGFVHNKCFIRKKAEFEEENNIEIDDNCLEDYICEDEYATPCLDCRRPLSYCICEGDNDENDFTGVNSRYGYMRRY